jgi:hypothetical protein
MIDSQSILHNYTIIEKDENREVISVQNLTNYLIEKENVACLEECLSPKMNYLSFGTGIGTSPLEKMTNVSGPLLVDKYFNKIKERYVHQIMRSLN